MRTIAPKTRCEAGDAERRRREPAHRPHRAASIAGADEGCASAARCSIARQVKKKSTPSATAGTSAQTAPLPLRERGSSGRGSGSACTPERPSARSSTWATRQQAAEVQKSREAERQGHASGGERRDAEI